MNVSRMASSSGDRGWRPFRGDGVDAGDSLVREVDCLEGGVEREDLD